MQQVAVMRLGNIGYVETLQAVRLIEVEPPKVKDMLYVLHAVDVSVHVYIAVASLYYAAAFSAILREFHTLERLNRARLVSIYCVMMPSRSASMSTGWRVSVSIIAQMLRPYP